MDYTHYTYIITEPTTGKYYIGSRTCKGDAIDDVRYMGSMVAWKPDKSNLVKRILRTDFLTRDAAILEESKLIQ